MKTISFLLFLLLANTAVAQENTPNTTHAAACGDSITKLLYMLVTEADALYEQKKYTLALERYNRYAELNNANAHVNDRIRDILKIVQERSSGCNDYEYPLEKIGCYAWKQYQQGNCGKALEMYRRMMILSPGNEEANSCYEEIAGKIFPDTANLQVRCVPEPLEPLDKKSDAEMIAAGKALNAASGCCIGVREKADRLYDEGNYSKALEYYKRCRTINPSDQFVKDRIAEIGKRMAFRIEVLQLPFPCVLPVPVNAQTK